ncbi:MAG: hypothetical protein AAGD06_13710 [Acidobacteriota bacterium]
MWRYQDLGPMLVQLLLLTAVTGRPAEPPRSTILQPARPAVDVTQTPTRERCFPLEVPEPGQYWITLHSAGPAPTSTLMVLGERGEDPRTVARIDAALLRFEAAGEHVACWTTDADPGPVDLWLQRAGDPLEIEEEIDPVRGPCPDGSYPDPPGGPCPDGRAGDPLEIEEEIDP